MKVWIAYISCMFVFMLFCIELATGMQGNLRVTKNTKF